MSPAETLPLRAWRSHVRFLEDAADAWREAQGGATTLFPVAEMVQLAAAAGRIACDLWDGFCAAQADAPAPHPGGRDQLRRLLRETLGRLRDIVDQLARLNLPLDEVAPLGRTAAEVADRLAEADLGLPWDDATAPRVSPEAARKGKEAARAGRTRDLGEVIRDLQAQG